MLSLDVCHDAWCARVVDDGCAFSSGASCARVHASPGGVYAGYVSLDACVDVAGRACAWLRAISHAVVCSVCVP